MTNGQVQIEKIAVNNIKNWQATYYYIFSLISLKKQMNGLVIQNFDSYRCSIMYLPMINNRNQKQPEKNGDFGQPSPFGEQFGLGIQVFKIQSSKGIQPHPQKQKKLTKNIESPIIEQASIQTFKRTPILPSLSTDKKSKTGGLNDTFKERKATIEKKKLVIPTDSIKQFEQRHRVLEKKTSSVQQVNKNQVQEQTTMAPIQKQITQKHYRTSINQLLDFYERFEERQAQNLKQIKRLKKAKDINNEEDLANELRLRQCKSQLAIDLAYRQKLSFFEAQQEYDEFSLTNYADGGWQFNFEDCEPNFQY